jgi:3-hydroxybutyryl-CoA dehydrogenase
MNGEIKTVAIVGAGTMGQGIAISCALSGYSTLLFDISPGFSEKALQRIRQSIDQSVLKGKLTEEAGLEGFDRIKSVNSLSDVKADLIIEAVIENLEVKQKLFVDLEKTNSKDTILATNTSSISIAQIASVLQSPSRFVGLHFFNPAHLMKLVEVISGSLTHPEIALKMMIFSKSLGKTPVEVKDSPGFIVNRVARHFYVESLKIVEEGVSDVEGIDRLLRSSGFKMGPFELMDLIGIDVNYSVTASVYEGFNRNPKFKPSAIQKEKIDQGFLGRKTGRGFYDYK